MSSFPPPVLLALVAATCAAACNVSKPVGAGHESADTGGEAPTGVDLVVTARALAACDPYSALTPAGMSTQTPAAVRIGLLGVQLLDSHGDDGPVPLLTLEAPLEVDLSAGAELVRIDTGSIPEGTYAWLAFDLAWAAFAVDATAHDSVTVAGTLSFDVALASYTAADGDARDQGDVTATFEAYGAEVSYPTSATITCALSASGGHPDSSDGAFRVRTPIPSGPVAITRDSVEDTTLAVEFPLADAFAWTERDGSGFADGTFDLTRDLSATESPESLPVCGLLLGDRCMAGAVAARPWPPGPVPDSSTTYCADDASTLEECPAPEDATYGQDGNYQVNPPSWTLTDDTVLDGVTGLLWERGRSPGTQDWWGSRDYCEALSVGGRDDWTLPSRSELLSILDLGAYNPTIDGAAFPDTPATFFWSSSPLPYSGLAYGVRFEQGYMYDHDPANSGHARCVCQAPPSVGTRWVLSDETVEDLRTELTWQRATPVDAFTWSAALIQCEDLALAGASDWRLPTLKELETIIDESRWGPSIDEVAFPDTPAEWFWASTPAAGAPGYPWAASFTNGYTTPAASGERYRVRCVR